MNRRVIFVAIGIGVLCAALVGYNFLMGFLFAGAGFMSPPPTPVETVTVKPGPWQPGVEAVGTARALEGADLAAEASGTIKEIKFKSNDRAAKGQLLIQIDDSIERADLQSANANTRLYSAQVSRSQALKGKGFVSQANLDQVQAQLGVAKSTRDRAQAVIDKKSIEAPFAGTVGIARVNVGQYVTEGTVLVTLQDLDRMKIDFTIPEQTAATLKVGQPTRFGGDKANLTFNGHIIGIDPKADPDSRLVAVQAEVANANGGIRAGQFVAVRVDMPTEEHVIALPQTAVMPSLYGDYVFVVGAPDPAPQIAGAHQGGAANAAPAPAPAPQGGPGGLVAKQTFITTGRRDGHRVEIVKGLKEGDVVVAAGQNRLQNGAPVEIAKPLGPAPKASGPAQ
jgi:membrane fusion protein (multidrug efflux system)